MNSYIGLFSAGMIVGLLIGVFLLQANVFYRVIITNEKQISEVLPEKQLKPLR